MNIIALVPVAVRPSPSRLSKSNGTASSAGPLVIQNGASKPASMPVWVVPTVGWKPGTLILGVSSVRSRIVRSGISRPWCG